MSDDAPEGLIPLPIGGTVLVNCCRSGSVTIETELCSQQAKKRVNVIALSQQQSELRFAEWSQQPLREFIPLHGRDADRWTRLGTRTEDRDDETAAVACQRRSDTGAGSHAISGRDAGHRRKVDRLIISGARDVQQQLSLHVLGG